MPLCCNRIGVLHASIHVAHKGHLVGETLSHPDPDLRGLRRPEPRSCAGLVPVMALADAAGLRTLTDERLTVATDKGANAGLKVASLIGGMLAGADSIDDMAVLRHGGMGKVFSSRTHPPRSGRSCALSPSDTCGNSTRSRLGVLLGLAARTRLFSSPAPATRPRPRRAGTRWLMSTTRSSRSTATRNRAPGSATRRSAGSTRSWPPSPPPDTPPSSSLSGSARARAGPRAARPA